MNSKKWPILGLCLGVALLVASSTSFAGEIDILVDKLVEKGILTRSDATEILSETRQEAARQAKQVAPSDVPKWVNKIKLKGDLRLRYEHKEKRGVNDIERGRVRYRLGIESKIVDKVTVGAGLASGSDSSTSARSTNQDLQDVFSTKSINLDYAYFEYEPYEWMSMVGGKFKRKKYLWAPSDLLWDGDINPEGVSFQFKHELVDNVQGFANTGFWILDESTGDTSDPYLAYIQPGVKAKFSDLGADAKVAVTYYDFGNVKGATLDGALGDNSTDSGGGLAFRYNPIAVAAEVGIEEPFDLPVPRVAAFGEFVHNPDPDDENNGWLLGLKLGDKKVKDKNQWQLKYIFARLEKDAFLDVLPDADRYSGGTDIVSHEGIIQFGLNKNIMVEFDYYHSNRVNAASAPENVFQTSANFKF